jgi:epsilon-lactone hydrolase
MVMASHEAEAAKQMYRDLAARNADREITLEERRAEANRLSLVGAEPIGITYEVVDAGGVSAEWTVPAAPVEDRVVIYLHGGGYVACSARSHSKLAGHLANAVGCRVLNVDYRIAPEFPHPAALTDTVGACGWLVEQGIDPRKTAISGDSAGAGLALATLMKLRADDHPIPAAAALLSPWVDLLMTGESVTSRAAKDLIVSAAGASEVIKLYVPGQDPRDPYVSPLYGDLTGLPPLYIQVGDEEVLLDDSRRLAEKADQAGVDVRLDVFPEMQHVHQLFVGRMPEADDAVERIGAFLRSRLGLDQRGAGQAAA